MITEAVLLVMRINLVAAVVVAIVLAVRAPARRWFGVHIAYALWIAVPLAIAGAVMPVDYADGPTGGLEIVMDSTRTWFAQDRRGAILLALWSAGVLVAFAISIIRQSRFAQAERSGRVGPAVVGFVVPRLVSPSDFAERFTLEERRLIRAHERAHMDRLDGRSLTVAVLAQCLCWFNPLAYVALRAFRLDQELACDATVMQRLPTQRRRYAETLLRSETGRLSPLYGLTWRGREPIETRIGALSLRTPPLPRFELGLNLLGTFFIATFLVAWISQPPVRPSADMVEAFGGVHIARSDLPPRLQAHFAP